MTLTPIKSDTTVEPFYPDADGQPMAESDPARKSLIYAAEALDLYFADRTDVYVSGNLFIYYEQGVKDAVVSPDVFVVFGAENHQRKSYKVWEEGGLTPDFVLEITSEATRHTDNVKKRRTYADLGVTEYCQYDPTGDYLTPALQGLKLVEQAYQPIATGKLDGDRLTLHSEVLALELRLDGGQLRFYDPETGKKLLSHRESEASRLEAEANLDQAKERIYRVAERLLASGMALAEVAEMVELSVAELQKRFDV